MDTDTAAYYAERAAAVRDAERAEQRAWDDLRTASRDGWAVAYDAWCAAATAFGHLRYPGAALARRDG